MQHICQQIIEGIVCSSCMCMDQMHNSNKWLQHYSFISRWLLHSVRNTFHMHRVQEKEETSAANICNATLQKGCDWNFSSFYITLFWSCGLSATTLLCANTLWALADVEPNTECEPGNWIKAQLYLCFQIEIEFNYESLLISLVNIL